MRTEIIQSTFILCMAVISSILWYLLITVQIDFESMWGLAAVIVAFFLSVFAGAGTVELTVNWLMDRKENLPPKPKKQKKITFGRG